MPLPLHWTSPFDVGVGEACTQELLLNLLEFTVISLSLLEFPDAPRIMYSL